ncbi:hypothetical protein SD71_09815 [Cohnella kolymensis]|uniref:Nucleic-acid-binding protein containing a Zn-ribbon n=1 Tax=Cohnella kolymensis TaxID=1590652 RepID=A0ABR5A5B9_9BACL|nr:Zn-ribbon domain-containing OB-fold protein [Cohnella kolymensis]KIL36227.1 hypothetical protein SD71_09815 [Cohnella kolymensis]
MAWDKPLPNIDLDIKPFWDGLREHKFLLFRCKECGTSYWPASYCRNCGNDGEFMSGLEWQEGSRFGTVFVFNIHHTAFHPGFKDEVPYVYALIELDDGPMFGTNIIGCTPDEVAIGKRVEIIFEDHLEEGFTLPKARLVP